MGKTRQRKNDTDNGISELLNMSRQLTKSVKAMQNVEAPLSNETLLAVQACIIDAQNALDEGFVNDACNDYERTVSEEIEA